jgi:hypothetical protein
LTRTTYPTTIRLARLNWLSVDTVIADAIYDRLHHSALTIDVTGESYRGVKAKKLASRNKDA